MGIINPPGFLDARACISSSIAALQLGELNVYILGSIEGQQKNTNELGNTKDMTKKCVRETGMIPKP